MIPLVRARYAANFLAAVGETGAPASRVLDKAELNPQVLENSDSMIPIWQLGQVARQSAMSADNLDIGWYAAETASLESYGEFSLAVFSRKSLFERLKHFCALAQTEYSLADFKIEVEPNQISFKRGPIVGDQIEARQTELYVLALMLQTVRSALGASWQPRKVCMQSFYRADTERLFDTRVTELRFDCPETSIAIGATDAALGAKAYVEGQDHAAKDFDLRARCERQLGNSVAALEELIKTHLYDRRLSLEFISRICGLHPRMLQLMLANEGSNFRDLVQRHRNLAAVGLLTETDASIAEISSALGYSHQAHFSRSFRDSAGFSPMQFRRLSLKQG
jgi:AraC-like DNA-binding protein